MFKVRYFGSHEYGKVVSKVYYNNNLVRTVKSELTGDKVCGHPLWQLTVKNSNGNGIPEESLEYIVEPSLDVQPKYDGKSEIVLVSIQHKSLVEKIINLETSYKPRKNKN